MESLEAAPKRGRGRPRLRSDDETLAIIAEAANREFLTHGYGAAGMEAVARAAGVSTKTLYRLVPTKAALFESVVAARLDRFTQALQQRPGGQDDITESLEALLVECGRLTLDPDVVAFLGLAIAERQRFPEIAAAFYSRGMTRSRAALEVWIGREARQGTIAVEDARLTAGMLLGMMISEPQRAALLGQVATPGEASIRERAKACAQLFLRGCLTARS